ncbi:hypothetical protein EJ110_NYTH44572 [Nymphaea thermarum]|nr:hypothetical protein EJ110_NYTH44572 [Nymphaea thermarum]
MEDIVRTWAISNLRCSVRRLEHANMLFFEVTHVEVAGKLRVAGNSYSSDGVNGMTILLSPRGRVLAGELEVMEKLFRYHKEYGGRVSICTRIEALIRRIRQHYDDNRIWSEFHMLVKDFHYNVKIERDHHTTNFGSFITSHVKEWRDGFSKIWWDGVRPLAEDDLCLLLLLMLRPPPTSAVAAQLCLPRDPLSGQLKLWMKLAKARESKEKKATRTKHVAKTGNSVPSLERLVNGACSNTTDLDEIEPDGWKPLVSKDSKPATIDFENITPSSAFLVRNEAPENQFLPGFRPSPPLTCRQRLEELLPLSGRRGKTALTDPFALLGGAAGLLVPPSERHRFCFALSVSFPLRSRKSVQEISPHRQENRSNKTQRAGGRKTSSR